MSKIEFADTEPSERADPTYVEVCASIAGAVAAAEAAGYVVTIERVAVEPLAMGNHIPYIKVYRRRK